MSHKPRSSRPGPRQGSSGKTTPRVKVQSGSLSSESSAAGPAADLVVQPKRVPMPDFGVVVFESRHAAGFVPSLLKNKGFSEFLLIIAGHARLEGGGHKFQVGPDSLVHIPPGIEYAYHDVPGQPVTLYAVQYRNQPLLPEVTQHLASLGILHLNLRRTGSLLSRAFRSGCKEMLYEQYRHQIGWETVLSSRLLDLVVRTLRFAMRLASVEPSFEKASNSLTRVINYAMRLESTFFLATTLDEAARSAGLSGRRFSTLYRNVTGQSWHKHLSALQLGHARQLLSQTDKAVVAVAFESGFDDLSHFNHLFRKAFGCSPSTFRNREGDKTPS